MSYYVTWTINNKIPLRERLGPFFIFETAVRELLFVDSDPRIKVCNLDIETVKGES